jgi:peroxiredoxin
MPDIGAHVAGSGARWSVSGEKPATLALVAFYRGGFCPICRVWLNDLDKLVAKFTNRGVSTIALSCDPREAAEKTVGDWGLKDLRLGYGVSIEDARRAGLYISEGRGMNAAGFKEPKLFCEPGLFLVNPQGELYAAWIQSTPYARVHIAEILTAVDNFIAKNIPAPRGSA